MNKKRIKKILKITLITLVSLLLVLAIAVIAVYNFVIKPNADKITDAVNVILQDEEILNEIKPYLTEEEFEKIAGDIDVTGLEEDPTSEGNSKTTDGSNSSVKNEDGVKKPQKDKSQYSSEYEYVKDNVDSKDFEVGVKFASRIDVGYVLGIVSGGITDSERQELKTYLKKHFTSEEIATGIRLYTKYSYLLNWL